MFSPILSTKLFVPPPRSRAVLRPRLVERLNEGLRRKLTLISAPVGFGKTTLVSEWIADCDQPAAWLSLDEGDNDPVRFMAYLIAALQTIAARLSADAAMGEGVLRALQSPQSPPTESLLTTLLNEIAAIPDDFALVLDDYHMINAEQVGSALVFLLEHLPPQMHLIIATREDPGLPLARLRARDQMIDLRAADLRFTPSEAAEFLNQVMGLDLSVEDIAALETRTEGWAAGLQLAALSMQGRSDAASFVQAFTGSHRFVLDYLVEEVLQRQPEPVRRFLLQTAILDRLIGPLCDAVTGREDSRVLLDALERANLFVVPLDDQRRWYRYHHLFADVLRSRILEEQPDVVPSLHRRASAWYEQNGLPADAIRHALAAGDFERAADMIELAWSPMDLTMRSATWVAWARALPDDLIRARPVLSVGYAWALLDSGEMDGSEARLRDAERWLDAPSNDMVVADKEQFRSLPATIAAARTYRALAFGDIPGTVKYARQALDRVPEEDYYRRVEVTILLGLAQYASGDLESASRFLTDLQAKTRKSGDVLPAVGIAFLLAEIKAAQGRLQEAGIAYQQALQLAADRSAPAAAGTTDLHRGLGEVYLERGDLEAAAHHLQTSRSLGEPDVRNGWQHRLYIAEARLQAAVGDVDGALALLDEAERVYVRGPLPDVRPIAAARARFWAVQGRLTEALGWAREREVTHDDDLSYLHEFEHITLARVFIARYRRERQDSAMHQAASLLERLLKAAEDGGRMGSVIEILALQALAHEAQNDLLPALAALERALTLAEPEGYVRVFVNEGPPMAALLREAAKRGIFPNYVNRLRAAFGQAERETPPVSPLVEPLSDREMEVLRLLGTEMSGPEIARSLTVSLSTVRTHTQNIYTKLGVNNRRVAIRRAEELGLL
ncbi:MAG: tetratricopeptide repeat protein [Anaerolineae bacterium]|nr:tetratricopeptide repeat protein [Anaerolineae bacterium]